jgi:DNA-binding Xre family transcriptional regulator
MVRLNVQKAAARLGITSSYQLEKHMGIHPPTAVKLWKGEMKMVGMETLDSLCDALQCEVADLFERTPNKKGARTTNGRK